MNRFGKILALGLAGASVLTGGFILSGCEKSDKNSTQTEQDVNEQKEVVSISIKESSLPDYIIRYKFSRTNIKMTVTYDDDSTKEINVTESMLNASSKEKLKNLGQHNLTVNHGGKTATIFANIVDERYLLKEVVEANRDKDVNITSSKGIVGKVDMDNKIVCLKGDDLKGWAWVKNNILYLYDTDNGISKGIGSEFENLVQNIYTDVDKVINGVDEYGNTWTIDGIEKDGLNYILTATQNEDWQCKYYFNDDFMYKIEELEGGHTESINYDYSIVNLLVPSDIKVLENGATVDVEEAIDDLEDVMSKYLESDFEMKRSNSTNDIFETIKYDADNKIIYYEESDGFYEWSWLNGDYYYSKASDNSEVWKGEANYWQGWVEECMFWEMDFDGVESSVRIIENGQYYELAVSFEGGEQIWEYKYVFNDKEICKVDVKFNGQYMGKYTYNKTNIVLKVPDEIKALESEAQ